MTKVTELNAVRSDKTHEFMCSVADEIVEAINRAMSMPSKKEIDQIDAYDTVPIRAMIAVMAQHMQNFDDTTKLLGLTIKTLVLALEHTTGKNHD